MRDFKPLVSIIIPVYNGADYVAEAIDSALSQSYDNIEVIVINDGSKDDGKTRAVVERYGDKLRYYEKENGGVASALNLGIDKMAGSYFSWLSHDDRYYIDKVQKQVDTLIKLQDADIVLYSNFDIINERSEVTGAIHLPHTEPEDFFKWIIRDSSLHGCTLLIPKKCFTECGKFDTALWTTQDYDLWFKMAQKFRFVHMSEMLISSRAHQQQTSISMPRKSVVECNQLYSKTANNLSHELASDTKYMRQLIDSFYKRGFYLSCLTALKVFKQYNKGQGNYWRKMKLKATLRILKEQRFLWKNK